MRYCMENMWPWASSELLLPSEKSTILISTDTEELLKLSDRIAVIYKGKLSKIMPSEEVTPEKLGVLMGGGSID